MKKIIIGMLFCLVAVYTFGKDVCYYYVNEKICYEVSATRMVVYSETLDITGIENALQNPVAGNLKNVYDMGDNTLFVVEMEHTSKEDMWALQRQLGSREDVIYTSPVFGGYPASAYTNKVYVSIKSEDDYPVLQEYANSYHITDIKKDFSGSYVLTLPHNPEKDAAEIAVELHETGLFQYVEADFIILCPFDWCPFEPEPDGNMNVLEERTIVFYPNPVSDILYIDLEKFVRTQNKTVASYDIRLYSSLGQMSRQAKASGGIVEFSVSNLPDGIYFLHIYGGIATKPETHKIIVKH
ncbi:MAG: T9SS type A sorting domain-containing protein [Tannerella sp.]|nr:T9SS type A sorting domain-containing protein [Tannerella sp.]